jgi:hypothetical protein
VREREREKKRVKEEGGGLFGEEGRGEVRLHLKKKRKARKKKEESLLSKSFK